MKLNLSEIRDITLGAVRIEESEKGIHFYRFTKQQEELYKKRSDDFYMKTFATSGVRIRFCTNSKTLFLKAEITGGSSRKYFSFDVFVNGKKSDDLNNFSNIKLPQNYAQVDLPRGEFSKTFELLEGEKEVTIYFPWSTAAVIKELAIDDNSFIKPVKPSKKILCFGDSITQGYDALHPSHKYITKLADMLDAEEHNKAIGGETFFPELAATKENFEPDYITVAYGTNDWSKCPQEKFHNNCKEFFDNLIATYPNAKILAITPIWRKDYTEYREFGKFEEVDKFIKSVAEGYENMDVITGFDFINHDENLYADLYLHPNDEGFEQYFKSLAKEVKTILKKA